MLKTTLTLAFLVAVVVSQTPTPQPAAAQATNAPQPAQTATKAPAAVAPATTAPKAAQTATQAPAAAPATGAPSAEKSAKANCHPPKFSFWDGAGAAKWPELFGKANGGACDGKARQSPIALEFKQAKYSKLLDDAKLELTDVSDKAEMEVENDGVKAHLKYNEKVTLKGLGLDGTHVLDHIHLHWGDNNNVGSEHSLDGKYYPAEIHMVFYKESLGNLTNAVKTTDGVAVLGVFLKAGKQNKEFDRWMKSFGSNCGQAEKVNSKDIEPHDFLPSTTCRERFYRYSGSLTTPNCDEVVVWTVFADPVEVSNEQLAALRRAQYFSQGKNGQMVNNFRPVQALAGRTVERSFIDSTLCTSGVAGLRALAVGPLALLALAVGLFLWRL